MSETTTYPEHRTERFVRINDRFVITREKKPDIHCWILHESYTGYKRGKAPGEKIPTRRVKQTYYGTLEQACMMVIEKSADGETAQAMIDAIHKAREEVVAAIDRHGEAGRVLIDATPDMYELLEEIAYGPYDDTDHRSLCESHTVRAGAILDKIDRAK